MAGLVPAIHVLVPDLRKTWMPGTRPGMTKDQKDKLMNILPANMRFGLFTNVVTAG